VFADEGRTMSKPSALGTARSLRMPVLFASDPR
jgi:hypothetical protein